MTPHTRLTTGLCEMLKLDWRNQPIEEFTLSVKAHELPKLRVVYIMRESQIDTKVVDFELHPVAAKFDLEKMVNDARTRVRRVVAESASRHLREMARPEPEKVWLHLIGVAEPVPVNAPRGTAA